jgi:hypothetical protein
MSGNTAFERIIIFVTSFADVEYHVVVALASTPLLKYFLVCLDVKI